LANGETLRGAVAGAKLYVAAAIAQFLRWDASGTSIDALNHFPNVPDS
jgi:hypothetical protein